MKKVYILFILSLILCQINANTYKSVPGYLNQRNTISLGIRPNITISDGESIIPNLFQPSFELTYDRVLSRRSTVSLTIGRQSFTVLSTNSINNFRSKRNSLNIYYDNELVELNISDGTLNFANNYFNISKTYFMTTRGAIAPYGKYFKMGFTNNYFRIKKDNLKYFANTNSKFVFVSNPDNDFITQMLGAFNFELGVKKFYGKHFFINKAIAFNFPFNFWTSTRFVNYNNMSSYHEAYLRRYIANIHTLNINFAVGYAF
ncbi:MAG: hypothetical protein Q8K70_01250 [Bacteroidota bacterium]|nr:hypothetical protein [Bacteroidota bacterium]